MWPFLNTSKFSRHGYNQLFGQSVHLDNSKCNQRFLAILDIRYYCGRSWESRSILNADNSTQATCPAKACTRSKELVFYLWRICEKQLRPTKFIFWKSHINVIKICEPKNQWVSEGWRLTELDFNIHSFSRTTHK